MRKRFAMLLFAVILCISMDPLCGVQAEPQKNGATVAETQTVEEKEPTEKAENESAEEPVTELKQVQEKTGESTAATEESVEKEGAELYATRVAGEETQYPDPSRFYDVLGFREKNEQGSVDMATGAMYFQMTDVVIPGANGLDLNVGVHYASNLATSHNISVSGENIGVHRMTYGTPLYHFASGWSFNFTHLEVKQYAGVYMPYIEFSDGTSYSIETWNTIDNEVRILGAAGEFKDIRLMIDRSFSCNELVSEYCLHYADGKKEYFDSNGDLLAIVNRYGDQISFEYAQGAPLDMELGERYNTVTIVGTNNENVTIVRDGQTITVEFPDGSSVRYQIEERTVQGVNVEGENRPENVRERLLQEKYNQQDEQTLFWYQFGDPSIFMDWYYGERLLAPLCEITYPWGLRVGYTYEKVDGQWASMGSMCQYYRVTTKSQIYPEGCTPFDTTEYYTYSDNDYTMQEDYSISHTRSDGTTTEYQYSKFEKKLYDREYMAKTSEVVYYQENGRKVILQETAYSNFYKHYYPTEIVTKKYNETGDAAILRENFVYDEYRNLLNYWDYRAKGDTDSTEHMIRYEYDGDYHLMTLKEYKRDANTTVKEQWILTEDKKNVAETRLLVNGVVAKRKRFTYGENSAQPTVVNEMVYANTSIITEYTYQGNAVVLSETVGQVTKEYTYDAMRRRISETNGLGQCTDYAYDSMGRMTQQGNPDGTTVTYTYFRNPDEMNYQNRVEIKNEIGQTTVYNYNRYNWLEAVSKQGVVIAAYEYDALGRVVGVTDGNGNSVHYAYDRKDRRISAQYYDATGNEIYQENTDYNDVWSEELQLAVTTEGVTSDNPQVSKIYTDWNGNVVKESRGTGDEEVFTTYTYDYLGNRLTQLKPNAAAAGKAYTYRYDYWYGNEIDITDVYGRSGYEMYDGVGRLAEVGNRNGHYQCYSYDERGNRTAQYTTMYYSDDEGCYTLTDKQMVYDAADNLIEERQQCNTEEEIAAGEERWRNTYYTVDSRGRHTTVSGDYEGTDQYTYDGIGNVIGVQRGKGAEQVNAEYTYTMFGKVWEYTDPSGRAEWCDYDDNGNPIIRYYREAGHIVYYTYDGLNRLIDQRSVILDDYGEEILEEQAETFIYYAGSKLLASVENSEQRVTYTYNSRGLPVTVTETTGGIVTVKSYVYDKEDNVISRKVVRDGKTIMQLSYTYDLLGRLLTVTDVLHGNTELAQYAYDNEGNVTEKELNGGELVTTYTYNGMEQPEEIESKTAAGKILANNRYTYYADGNVRSVEEHDGTETVYEYDAKGRLGVETVGAQKSEYSYDSRDNLVNLYDDNEMNYSSDKNDRMVSCWSADGSMRDDRTYLYDAEGKPVKRYYYAWSEEEGEVVVEKQDDNTYDLWNRLIKIDTTDKETGEKVQSVSYTYGADGLRLSKTVDGVRTDYIWDGGQLIAEITGGAVTTYYYGVGLIGSRTDSKKYYYLTNGHGDVTHVIGTNNGVVYRARYDAFGNQELEEGTLRPSFRYCGEYYDAETGLYYLRARYYDPKLGKFLTEDPARDGLNWYAYCGNNPVMFVDPWGEEYGKLRDFVNDYQYAFDGNSKIEFGDIDGRGYAYVTLGKYERAFYFDGTIVNREYDDSGILAYENRVKIADNINGTLYMQRSAFVIAMGMVSDGTATVQTSDNIYVSDALAILDFATYVTDAVSLGGDIKDIASLAGMAPVVGQGLRNSVAVYGVMNNLKNGNVLSSGAYKAESVRVKSPYHDWYSYRVNTLYGIEANTAYYQWVQKEAFAWGWLPGGK